MGHGVGTVAAGLVDQVADDHRARQRRDERVLALVPGVGGDGGHHEVLGHLGPGVDDDRLDRAGGQGPAPDHFEVAPLADVQRPRR